MTNCWSIGIFLVFFLGSFCLWNCLRRDNLNNDSDWYGCRDQQGNPVDFFILYKLPQEKSGPLKSGAAYMYLVPDASTRLQSGGVSSVLSYSDSTSGWIFSNVSINNEYSMPARTLRRLYQDPSFRMNAAYIMYNDEFPNGTTSDTYGHSKGVFVMSNKGGYWLIHSVPRYPPAPKDAYQYPHNGHRYGQTMLCISLAPSQTENLGWQLIQNNIYIYDWNLPNSIASKYPVLKKVVSGYKPTEPPFYRITQIISLAAKSFTSFAKYRKFDQDLYSGLVAPLLKTDLLVEAWRNGKGPLPNVCNATYKVENIVWVSAKAASTNFSNHRDHSKWAVALKSDKPYVCVGDINRMAAQLHRGGGTVCIWSLSLWHRFKGIIQDTDTCDTPSNGKRKPQTHNIQ